MLAKLRSTGHFETTVLASTKQYYIDVGTTGVSTRTLSSLSAFLGCLSKCVDGPKIFVPEYHFGITDQTVGFDLVYVLYPGS